MRNSVWHCCRVLWDFGQQLCFQCVAALFGPGCWNHFQFHSLKWSAPANESMIFRDFRTLARKVIPPIQWSQGGYTALYQHPPSLWGSRGTCRTIGMGWYGPGNRSDGSTDIFLTRSEGATPAGKVIHLTVLLWFFWIPSCAFGCCLGDTVRWARARMCENESFAFSEFSENLESWWWDFVLTVS